MCISWWTFYGLVPPSPSQTEELAQHSWTMPWQQDKACSLSNVWICERYDCSMFERLPEVSAPRNVTHTPNVYSDLTCLSCYLLSSQVWLRQAMVGWHWWEYCSYFYSCFWSDCHDGLPFLRSAWAAWLFSCPSSSKINVISTLLSQNWYIGYN